MLHEDSPLFAEAESRGYLLTAGYERVSASGRAPATYREGQRYLDFSDPAVGRWWWAAHQDLRRLGITGWWLDGGEGPPATAKLQAGDGTLLHNVYDRHRHQAFAEGEAADRPDQRVFLLCRSGAAGMQRYGATCWSGDINNDFPTLEAQVPLGLNTGLSGIPYWGTDIGGFFHPVPETGELYARWFQLGAFSPIFRSHGWVWREHVPWAHGPEVEAICRRYAELRYQLLPYTYTLAWQAYTHGPAPHAPAGPQLSRRPPDLDARPRVPVGRRPPGGPGDARGRDGVAGLPPRRAGGTTSGPGASLRGPRRRHARRPRSTACRSSSGPGRSCRWARSSSTPASGRSTR